MKNDLLALYLDDYFQDIELKHIFKDVIGTDDANNIQLLLNQATRIYLKSNIVKIIFINSSIGVVFGFLLDNGDRIVLKVFSPKLSKSYLDEMNHIQAIFYQQKFPAPKILSPIFKFANTHAGLYQLIDGNAEDAHQSVICLELAKYLAEFAKIVEENNLKPLGNFFQQSSKGKLWPTPHNVLINLKKTTRGAGWIAKKATQARKVLVTYKKTKMLAHTDWGIKNATFCNKKLVGIFDWDSLGEMTELEMVGRACAQFTADWESDFKITPSADEGRHLVQAYQDYRQKKFTTDEYKVISASADYLIAIIARFEHASGNSNIHPYQDLLKECGERGFLYT